ncbi:hypothetical protein TrVFT333_008016 [Trichoderma virens FT-333]|nr:hypothetical protein TrVFT333_008016 [Trichoderma virens FT-333]
MDFNPMDEDTPLRDYWQTTDDLDNEDAATIASLATQVLQAKSGYDYGEGIEVNEPAMVANYMYSESRSSPQSQYSTTHPMEPAESFRGLMEDHDRGAQMLEERAASEYDFEPEAQGQASSGMAGIEEPTSLSREHYVPEDFSSMLNVSVEVEATHQSSYTHEIEMSAAMTASRVVNGVLSRSYAGTPTEEAVNLQALQSQAPQLTPPQSESRSVSVERSDHAEQEKEPSMEADAQRFDDEPKNARTAEEGEGGEREGMEEDEMEEIEEDEREEGEKDEREQGQMEGDERGEMEEGEREGMERDETDEEEPTPDTGAQQQLIMESNERSIIDDDERELPLLQQTPRKRGRPRRSDAEEAPPAPATERPIPDQIAVQEKDSRDENEAVEPAATDDADIDRAEEVPTERKRGRPRKSEISEPVTPAAPTPAKRGPGRPPKVTDLQLIQESTPAAGKRGRPRKNSMADAAQMSAVTLELSAVEAPAAIPAPGKRGRPRKSSIADATQRPAVAPEVSTVGTPVPSKRGRPRKSDAMDAAQTPASSARLPVVGVAETGKRGRPRKSDVLDAAPSSSNAVQETATTPARSSSKRGRPRKSDVTDAAQASTEVDLLAVEVAETEVSSGKRGRPRKSDVLDAAPSSSNAAQETATTPARSLSKRGRPRKSDTIDATQVSNEESQLSSVEAPVTATPASAEGDLPAVEVAETGVSSGKRGRPRKSDTIDATQASTEELQLSSVEAPVTATPASGKRGRPGKSDMMGATPMQASIYEAQLPVVEASVATTPASGERRPPLNAIPNTTIPTTTPGKRGRPPKNAGPLMPIENGILPIAEAPQRTDSPTVKSIGRRGRPPRQADTLEERAVSPTPQSTKKRGRGRPPKSEALLPADLPNTTVEPGLGTDSQEEAEPHKPSKPTIDVWEDYAVGEIVLTPAQEDIEVAPAKKRGRPKAAAVDKAPSVIDMLVTASAKKRGRPPKAIATVDSAEDHGRNVQSEAQEEEEEPAAKRKRTDNNTTMEDVVGEDETRGDTREDELPGVEELGDAVAANDTARKRLSVTWAMPLSSTLTEPKTVTEPSPQLDRHSRLSGEVLDESTRAKQVEQPPLHQKLFLI